MRPNNITIDRLREAAQAVRRNSHAPYSGFSVGAALLTKDGRIYTGCNMENASYGATSCAERGAFHSAIAAGERDFAAILIIGGMGEQTCPTFPCGICRQMMAELCPEDFSVLTEEKDGICDTPLATLLPHAFQKEVLQ